MAPDPPAERPSRYPVYVVGRETNREALANALAAIRVPVETFSAPQFEREGNPPATAVVCLPPETRESDTSTDRPTSVAGLVATVTTFDLDCPVVAVGPDLDARAAYEAGATEVVPLAPADSAELVAGRIKDIADSVRPEDDTDLGLAEALSIAFPDYAFVYGEDGQYLDVITGRRSDDTLYTDDELLGQTVHDLLDRETADRIVAAIGDALSTGGIQTVEYALDRPSGTAWYRGRIAPLSEPYEGSRAAVLVARDITERKQRERELQRERKRRSALFEELGEPVVEVTFEGDRSTVRAVNDAFVDVFGIGADDIVGDPLNAHIVPEDDKATARELNRRVRNGDIVERELQRETADGPRSFLFRPVPFTVDGDRHAYAIYYDITERKRQQERFQAFIEQSTDIVTVLDADGTYEYQSPSSERVVGYEPEELLGENAFQYVHPEDRESLVEAFTAAIENPETTPTAEYRFKHADGSWRWVESIGNNQVDNPAIEGFVVNSRDITERKERERELQRTERRFDAVFNAPSALVTLLDTDGTITEISDAAVALVPESREEIRGRPLWEGPWFEDNPALQERLRETVEQALDGESARIETSVPIPDRELVIDAMFEPVTDDEGQLQGVVGVARDVTERHRTQRTRRQLLATTQEMIAAESPDQLAGIVSEAAESILGHDLNAVYLHSPDGEEELAPVVWTDRIDDLFGGAPALTGTGPVTEAYRRGEPAIYDTIEGATDRPAEQYDPVTSLIALPIGDHGVLAVGETERGAFTEADVDRYRLLTVSAAAILDRLERTLELQRYETLFETVQDRVYVLDEEGYIELVSDSLAETVGYDPADLEGEHVSEVVTEETAREVERLILDLVVTPEEVSSTCEGTLEARDGTETPVEIELSVLPHEENFRGTAGVIRDISERRQREEELRVFQRAIREAGIGLAMYGQEGRFESVNDHYADLLGQSREALEDSPVWNTVESLDPAAFENRWEALEVGSTVTRQTEHQRPDGSTVPVETVTTAVEIDGTRHHILTVQDITDRRERRQQAQALHRIFRHNLRNDLTVLCGHASILADELSGEFASNVETMVEKTESLIDLTETATEARSILEHDTSRRPIDVVDMLQDQVADLRERVPVTVETDLSDQCRVWADSMLGVAIENLLANAVEHHDSASPQVWVRVGPDQDREDWVAIDVADDGPGIPDIERETLTAGEEGQIQHSVGLGLWIVRWIVSRYGGDLSFHDRNPRGTRVRIALPAADETAREEHPPEGSA